MLSTARYRTRGVPLDDGLKYRVYIHVVCSLMFLTLTCRSALSIRHVCKGLSVLLVAALLENCWNVG